MLKSIPESWQNILASSELASLLETVEVFLRQEEKDNRTFFPARELIFRSFELANFDKLKVVILGQDPYHDDNQACGLAFSVPQSITKLPPSLKNIYKELANDLGCEISKNGDLSSWSRQGVLLLNTVLTVRAHEANSHKGVGWEDFTDLVISRISQQKEHVVFILWGANAISKIPLIDTKCHTIIQSVHPSPLSANRGFFGSKPFSKCNAALQKFQLSPINWQIQNKDELF